MSRFYSYLKSQLLILSETLTTSGRKPSPSPPLRGATVNAIRILQKLREYADDTPTTIRLRVPEDERSHFIFKLDNGATVNIVRLKALDGSLTIDTSNALKIVGITPELLRTIRTVNLSILKNLHASHVVHDDFPLLKDGIIGRNLLKSEEAVVSYYLNPIILARDVMNSIPFSSHEGKAFHLNEETPPNDHGYPHDPVAPI